MQSAREKVIKCYKQTFWAIPQAFVCCQAAIALAKRGLNIDRMFLFWGAGGVGLSLFTAHLAAAYGHRNHRYFDPNIFYTDEELRKVIELLAGAFIFTGQEKPTNTKQVLQSVG